MSYNDTCSVCLDEFSDSQEQATTLSCGHKFHTQCIIKSLRKSNECPYCRDTDGNPVSKVSASNFHTILNPEWTSDFDSSNESEEEEYSDFIDCMRQIIRKNKDLGDTIRDYKKSCKKMEKKCIEIEKNYDKQWSKFLSDFLKNFKESEEFKAYLNDKKEFQKNKNLVRNRIKSAFEKQMDIPKDANSEFVSKYLEDMFDGYFFNV